MKNKAIIRSINSKALPISVGDTVYINPTTVMQYQLNLERFYIIKEQYVLGKEV
jgi:co-chaperonin GroES (HSP10)